MSKITFRADEDLVERIEARDASKSEIMREALRAYLDGDAERGRGGSEEPAGRDGARSSGRSAASGRARAERARTDTLDAVLAERVDELVAERLAAREPRGARGRPQDVNVNVTLESDAPVRADADATRRATPSDEPARAPPSDRASDARPVEEADESTVESDPATETTCGQCGESLSDDHVYCPNCGEKAARRLFCECGDEVRSDWGFCPSCGRRTPAADVLDRS